MNRSFSLAELRKMTFLEAPSFKQNSPGIKVQLFYNLGNGINRVFYVTEDIPNKKGLFSLRGDVELLHGLLYRVETYAEDAYRFLKVHPQGSLKRFLKSCRWIIKMVEENNIDEEVVFLTPKIIETLSLLKRDDRVHLFLKHDKGLDTYNVEYTGDLQID